MCGLEFRFVDRMNYSSENMEERQVNVVLSDCSLDKSDVH